ncbi:MAG: nucleotide sugar dehydrogenase [Sphingosinicella sp.]|uniref:nucleotide sugar dehydrogenase n=1 Tax=Sphingosinicella sp. TaxID=1917971 RepID=UPI00403840EE
MIEDVKPRLIRGKIESIVVLGLGYVGLPLAVALARKFDVAGLDIDADRISELRCHQDRTNEVDASTLAQSTLLVTTDPEECRSASIYIITVPTPVDSRNRPDLGPIIAASKTVGRLLDPQARPVVVYESTVYPGLTEEVCGPILTEQSGLICGRDFFLGYSPERINPGDRQHTIDRIVKVVAGQDEATINRLAAMYGAITSGGVFRAASIKAAEAAKVIENAQRDINIAFINEITQIFGKLGISVWDVLEAAGTKWNFLSFKPGLVGGHCIGVDPYYLSHLAQELGHDPKVILAGRSTNDGMGGWIAESLHAHRGCSGSALVLGLTFKENVPDLRNSRVVDVIDRLGQLGHEVTVHDPRADPAEARERYGIALDSDALARPYDLVLVAVPHAEYGAMDAQDVGRLVNKGGCVADLKGIWRTMVLGPNVDRWSL